MALVKRLLSNREDGPDCVSTASCLACPEGSEIKSELFLYTVQLNTFYAVNVVWWTQLSKVSDVVTWCRDTLTLTLDWACGLEPGRHLVLHSSSLTRASPAAGPLVFFGSVWSPKSQDELRLHMSQVSLWSDPLTTNSGKWNIKLVFCTLIQLVFLLFDKITWLDRGVNRLGRKSR